jgi:hypothetical protein
MLSCRDGRMMLSSVPSTYQLGILVKAGVLPGWLRALRVTGRCSAAMTAAVAAGTPLANALMNTGVFRYRSTSPAGAPGYVTSSNKALGLGPPGTLALRPRQLWPLAGANAST